MSKKPKLSKDETIALYNTYVPVVSRKIKDWKVGEDGLVTLSIENKGAMNTIMQKMAPGLPQLSCYLHSRLLTMSLRPLRRI